MYHGELFVNGGTLAMHMLRNKWQPPAGFTLVETTHMTLLDIADGKQLRRAWNMSNSVYESWLETLPDRSVWGYLDLPDYVGIGQVTREGNSVYFDIWEWPDLQEWRATMNLPPKDLHVTLAIRGCDIHGVPKDHSTRVF